MEKKQWSTLVTRVTDLTSWRPSHCPFSLGGSQLSEDNSVIFQRCLRSWLFLIEDLMLRLDLSAASREARRSNFVGALASGDLLENLSFLEDLYAYLIQVDVVDPSTFKQWMEDRSSGCCDYRRLLSPINPALYQFLNETDKGRKAHLLSSIAQFLRFPRKLVFRDIGLEDVALASYVETESELEAAEREFDSELVQELAKIVHEWFGDFHIENLRPMHGPGSVAEGSLTLSEKFRALGCDRKMQILLRNPSNPESFREYYPIPPSMEIDRCSRTIFVPKTVSKLRTISMEPASLQYIQQGVMYEMYQYIEKHPYLGIRIRLGDQTQNQVWALVGSKYHNYGTIDLSKASDTVSWDLVRRVFRSCPSLFKWLLGTRSSCTILPDGTRLQLRKFAPMGSALCFPTECIIFAAVAEYATRKAGDRPGGFDPFWSVYGDDIIVHSSVYEIAITALSSLGFQVNASKSYNSGSYRESCGKEYYEGFDITPLYYRTPFYRSRVSPGVYGSWCSSANNAYAHRLPCYRRYLIDQILRFSKRTGPYFQENPDLSPYLYSPQPTNFHVKSRWNKGYQRFEGRFLSVGSRPRDVGETDDTLAYFCRLVEMSKRGVSPRSHQDVPASPMALQGLVEFFTPTRLPIQPFKHHDLMLAVDW